MAGKLAIVKWLLNNGASITAKDSRGVDVWVYMQEVWVGGEDVMLISLLKVMVLRGEAPPDFFHELPRAHAMIVAQGRTLRTQKPKYLEQQCALIRSYCALPAVLQPLILAYAAPTHEDMWTDWLK
jgi:hypothetical protein